MHALGLITIEILFVSLVIILLYRLKGYYGLPLIYIFVGSNQYLQAILASTLYLPVFDKVIVSPGSVVMFSSSLFAILLIYLKADVPQTRTMIYGIVLSNITLTILSFITNMQMGLKNAVNLVEIPPALFTVNARVFLVGTATLILDAFLIIVLYEFLFFKIRKLGLLGRIMGTMLGVLYFDAVAFSLGSFLGESQLSSVLYSQLIGKTYSGIIYGLILYGYLVFIDRQQYLKTSAVPQEMKDIFNILTYREKYEYIKTQKELTDIKLQVSENKWETLVENVPDTILTMDKEGCINYLNRPFGGRVPGEGTPFSIFELMSEDYHHEIQQALPLVFDKGEHYTCEFSRLLPDHTLAWYLGRMGPIMSESQINTAICILTDITPLKLAEAERERLHDELLQKQKMAAIGETIEGIAHSMKTIFTPLNASVDLIHKAFQDRDWILVEQSIRILKSSSRHLYLMFMNMLDYSKTRKPHYEIFEVQKIFNEVSDMLQSSTSQKHIQIEYNVETGAERLSSDPERISRALMNLGMNSIDAIKESGMIRMIARKLDKGISLNQIYTLTSNSFVIEFHDDGEGLPDEYRANLFIPFVSTKGARGTGLGLCTVKQFMQEQGGDIFLDSSPGRGTVFYLVFPLKN